LLVSWNAQGRLHRPAPAVYVVAGSETTWKQQVSIATASSDGWASHRTAADLWGLDDFERSNIEVLRHHGEWRRRTAWTVHVT